MSLVKKAGAIIFSQNDPTNVAILYRQKQNDWSFPKGHIEDGENFKEAVLREVKEETGLTVSFFEDSLPDMEYNHSGGDKIIVHMCLVRSENDFDVRVEYSGDKIVWVNYRDVVSTLSYDNIKKYYLNIFPKIESSINKNVIYRDPKIMM